MRNPRLFVVLLAFAAAAAASSGVNASDETAAGFVKAILPALPVEQEPCQDIEGAGTGSVLVCARTSADFEAFRQTWELGCEQKVPVVPSPLTDWVTQVGGRMRWYALGDKWVVVTYDAASRTVAISYARDRNDVLPLERDIVPPKRIPSDESAAVSRTRQGLKAEAQGVVVMSAVIRKDGTVGDVEVLGCVPRHQGLEQAAMKAIKRWRYEPATKDGAAVNVWMTSSFTYGPGGFFRTVQNVGSADSSRAGSVVKDSPGLGSP